MKLGGIAPECLMNNPPEQSISSIENHLFSQFKKKIGTTVFFVMTSTRPEYNKKIDQAILMAPAALLRNTDNTFYKILGKFSSEVSMMGQTTGLSKITTQNIQYVKKLEFFCRIIKPADSCNFNEWFIQLDGVDPVRIFFFAHNLT